MNEISWKRDWQVWHKGLTHKFVLVVCVVVCSNLWLKLQLPPRTFLALQVSLVDGEQPAPGQALLMSWFSTCFAIGKVNMFFTTPQLATHFGSSQLLGICFGMCVLPFGWWIKKWIKKATLVQLQLQLVQEHQAKLGIKDGGCKIVSVQCPAKREPK